MGQAVPHEPQLALFDAVSTQVPGTPVDAPQTICPVGQRQVPEVQVAPAAQVVPHAPQLELLVAVFTQTPPQSVWPEGHPQTPAVQICPPVQVVPQPPQLLGSVPRVLVHTPPQLTSVPGHTHAPPEQTVPPLQTRAHAPQLLLSAERLVSQPLVRLVSQSPKPALHAPSVQRPVTHEAAALENRQRLPHMAQWLALLARLTSQPLVTSPSQLAKPGLHEIATHAPPAQVGRPLVRLHARPHAPQLFALVLRSVSQLPLASQSALVVGTHDAPTPQTLAVHVGVRPIGAEQMLPQREQLVTSVVVFTSQPLAALPSQSAKPAVQALRRHTPAEQVAPALGKLQRFPQAPQLFTSVAVLVSQPAAGPAPLTQSLKPARHAV